MTWKIDFSIVDVCIHREDAARAISAKLNEARKNRPKTSEEIIVQDLFIACLVNNRHWNGEQLAKIGELSTDKAFAERMWRALATDKPPTWDQIDILILRNWRDVHLRPDIQTKIEAQEGKLPGLSDWSPKAIAGLFELETKISLPIGEDSSPESFIKKRRERLGLLGKNSYQVKDFIVINNSVRVVR